MQSVAGATGNIVYEEATLRIKDEVATGQRLQRAMENTGLFPNMVIQMIAVGEESGSLDTMAGKVARFLRGGGRCRRRMLMSSLMEPLIIMAVPRRLGRRHGHRHVPAHLQTRLGGVTVDGAARSLARPMLSDVAAIYTEKLRAYLRARCSCWAWSSVVSSTWSSIDCPSFSIASGVSRRRNSFQPLREKMQ